MPTCYCAKLPFGHEHSGTRIKNAAILPEPVEAEEDTELKVADAEPTT